MSLRLVIHRLCQLLTRSLAHACHLTHACSGTNGAFLQGRNGQGEEGVDDHPQEAHFPTAHGTFLLTRSARETSPFPSTDGQTHAVCLHNRDPDPSPACLLSSRASPRSSMDDRSSRCTALSFSLHRSLHLHARLKLTHSSSSTRPWPTRMAPKSRPSCTSASPIWTKKRVRPLFSNACVMWCCVKQVLDAESGLTFWCDNVQTSQERASSDFRAVRT
jgi:hypothetical protein